ncbi:MAG: ABC transporter permease [Planctomycetota bacterium]|nr:ABC transporter permease [Planctomycetota bacterium]
MSDRRWKTLRRNKTAMVGAVIIGMFVVVAVFAGVIGRYDPEARQDEFRAEPSAAHWMGTDKNGFDMWSRMVHGARASLMAAVCAVAFALFIGVPLGLIAGYRGGWIDGTIMRVVDVMLAFPSVLLAVAVAALFERTSLFTVILAVGVVMVPTFIRQVRAAVLQVKPLEYVTAARALGASDRRILFRTVLPNCIAPIVVLATLSTGVAILDAAGLSFLGLGPEATVPEWGVMLKDGFSLVRQNLYWIWLPPGLAIALTVLGFNLLGDGLRDAFDPRQI